MLPCRRFRLVLNLFGTARSPSAVRLQSDKWPRHTRPVMTEPLLCVSATLSDVCAGSYQARLSFRAMFKRPDGAKNHRDGLSGCIINPSAPKASLKRSVDIGSNVSDSDRFQPFGVNDFLARL